MASLHPIRPQAWRGKPSRRGLLRIGVSAGMAGLGLTGLLRLKAQAAEQGGESKDTAIIQIWLGGGPSHFETYDPKPDAPAEFRGPFDSIPTRLAGVRFCELMPRQAAIAEQLAVIRSVHHTTDDHHAGMHWCTTAHHANAAGNFAPTHPSIGSVASRICGAQRPGLPAYVQLGFKSGNPVYDANHNAAYLGGGFDPFRVTADPSDGAFRVDNLQLVDGVTLDRFDDRRQLRRHFDRIRRDLDAAGTMRVLDQFDQMALDLIAGTRAREAFDLSREDPRLRDRYGRNRWGQSALLARRLVEHGVTFVTVNTDPHSFTWDMHGSLTKPGADSNARVMPEVGPILDKMVCALVEDLLIRGLDRRVLVVVWGEFGRTPRVNTTGGRDHWGAAMSVVLAGGGLRMGQVIGSTTAKGEVPRDRPLWPQDVAATMYYHLGIDPAHTFLNPAGRPVPVLADGEVIRELV
jgi:hypothetical protein